MAHLEVTDLSKRFGGTVALHPIELSVEQGEFITLLGPSGCGKSTFLRMLMGITVPTSGQIVLSGRRIERDAPERRNVSMVFQSYALFPHLTVLGNLRFGLRMKRVPRPEQQRRVEHAVRICNLGAYLDRMPKELSGGQQQRVALARAIVMQPDLLLFDEPLSNLDAKLRESLREELLDLHRRVGATSLYVTHDQDEAMAMSDRIVVINDGRVVETGTPAVLYHRPKTLFTARFLGHTSIVKADADGDDLLLPWGQVAKADNVTKGKVHLSIRPEDFCLHALPDGPGTVVGAQFLGASIRYRVEIGGQTVMASVTGREAMLPAGARVSLTPLAPLHLLENGGA
ncbi:ABC transporter ATP-binding protein [Rhizobium sp. KAs_5_22]|uniref:ABC transporter ATP-binding protein n=1 Tax=Ciceribacter selenitireducens TaxID=448181 RepID=UPI00048D4CB3|nr:ABC transporter ATP-binding protein [Ciceribacter selenitireducens]PPJ48820.1 ABC transporter ATP-binding protein [Rhizobium sp. KAs_5_22]